MISQQMSETIEGLLEELGEMAASERTAVIMFLSVYLMHHAQTLLKDAGDVETAKRYAGLTRQMEALMQAKRGDRPVDSLKPGLRLVKK